MRMYSFSEYPHSKIPRAFARGILVMTAKIRHNRARGSHDVDLMSNIVAELTEMGKIQSMDHEAFRYGRRRSYSIKADYRSGSAI